MILHNVELPEDVLADFCRRNRIRRLSVFGSILREDFQPQSDVDVLVEFEPGAVPGFGFVALQEELAEMLRHPVDLHTPASLSRYFRDEVLHEAKALYVAA